MQMPQCKCYFFCILMPANHRPLIQGNLTKYRREKKSWYESFKWLPWLSTVHLCLMGKLTLLSSHTEHKGNNTFPVLLSPVPCYFDNCSRWTRVYVVIVEAVSWVGPADNQSVYPSPPPHPKPEANCSGIVYKPTVSASINTHFPHFKNGYEY